MNAFLTAIIMLAYEKGILLLKTDLEEAPSVLQSFPPALNTVTPRSSRQAVSMIT